MTPKNIPIIADTNILVPAAYRATPIFYYLTKGDLVLVWNKFIYYEAMRITKKMWHNYYKDKIQVVPDDIYRLLDILFDIGIKVPDMPRDWQKVSNDRKDDPFLFAAKEGNAEYIISKDKRHMTKLKHFENIPIGNANDFFKWVKRAYPFDKSKER